MLVLVISSAAPFGASASVICCVAAVAMLVDGPSQQSRDGGQSQMDRKCREEGHLISGGQR
jgi:hypothetical protein